MIQYRVFHLLCYYSFYLIHGYILSFDFLPKDYFIIFIPCAAAGVTLNSSASEEKKNVKDLISKCACSAVNRLLAALKRTAFTWLMTKIYPR